MEQNNSRPRFNFQRPSLNKEPIQKSVSNESETDKKASKPEPAPSTPRNTSARTVSQKTERAKEVEAVVDGPALEDQDFNGLMERHRDLVRQRDQLTYQKAEAARKLAACVAEAKRMGIDSLEEMREKIAELQALDKAAKESFVENLNAEEKLQSHIAEQLKHLDNE